MALGHTDMQSYVDNITCAVCFEIYKDPQALKCLHTFCKSCVASVSKAGRIMCPECREYTLNDAVKNDFKTQSFINIFNRIPGGTSQLNKMGFRRQNSRKLENQQYYQTINDALFQFHKERNHVQQRVLKVNSSIKALEKAETRQMSAVDMYTDDAISDLNLNRERLKQVIKESNAVAKRRLKWNEQMYVENMESLQEKLDCYQENVDLCGDDQQSLCNFSSGLEDKVKQEIESLRTKQETNEKAHSSVTVSRGENWDVRNVIQVKIQPASSVTKKDDDVSLFQNSGISAAENVVAMPFHTVVKVDLNYHPHRLYMIDQKLWCVTLNAIHIYNPDNLAQLEVMTNSHLRFARGLTQTANKDIIVACSNRKGLLHLNQRCQYQRHILDDRSFSDVISSNDNLFALDCDNGKVVIFSCSSNNQWVQIHEFNTHHSNIHTKDRIAVYNGEIFISSVNNNCLYIFSVNGYYKHQIGCTGSTNKPGEFSGALLCNIDRMGNVLVADYSNNRLQVYENEQSRGRKEWCFVVFPGCNLHNPVDALTDEHADFTWVITNQPQQLLRIADNS